MAVTENNSGPWTIINGTASDVVTYLDDNGVGSASIVDFTHDGTSGEMAVLLQP